MAAFQHAISMGARALELDVHLTRDERVAVLHDSLLERTTNGAGLIGKLSADEIRGLDAGSWYSPEFAGQRVPFLEDVLRLTGGRTRLHVELKGEHGDLLAARVVEEVKRSQATGQVLIMSFDLNAVLAARNESRLSRCSPLSVANSKTSSNSSAPPGLAGSTRRRGIGGPEQSPASTSIS